MDVVIFVGGKGKRIRPLVAPPLPKHLIPVGDRPLLHHVIETALTGGGRRLFFSLNGRHTELTIETVSDYREAVTLPTDVGIAYTHSNTTVSRGPIYDLACVAPFLTPYQPFVVLYADGYYTEQLDFHTPHAPHLWTTELRPEEDSTQFGQVIADGATVREINEKPNIERSRVISTGVAKLPYEALQLASVLCTEDPENAHMSHLLDTFIEGGHLTHTKLPANTFYDCGTPASWKAAHQRRLALLEE